MGNRNINQCRRAYLLTMKNLGLKPMEGYGLLTKQGIEDETETAFASARRWRQKRALRKFGKSRAFGKRYLAEIKARNGGV